VIRDYRETFIVASMAYLPHVASRNEGV
jgi:hypothetical protein